MWLDNKIILTLSHKNGNNSDHSYRSCYWSSTLRFISPQMVVTAKHHDQTTSCSSQKVLPASNKEDTGTSFQANPPACLHPGYVSASVRFAIYRIPEICRNNFCWFSSFSFVRRETERASEKEREQNMLK